VSTLARAIIALGALAFLLVVRVRADGGIAPGALVERVPCAADPRETYALYLPSSYGPGRPFPILYCFDPRARGQEPVERFRAAAERYGWIVVGSNASRNGIPVTDIVSRLWDDTHRRFAIDERRVYTAGFSGGARVASGIALSSRGLVAGVMAFGAGLPSGARVERNKDMPIAFFAGAGRDDFNLLELRQLAVELDAASIPNRLEVWDGGHEWAPPELCTLAVEWLELAAMRAGTRTKDGALVEQWARRDEERARQHENAGALVEAAAAFHSLVEDFRGLRETGTYAQDAARIRASKAYKDDARAQRDDDRRQLQITDGLAAAIQGLLGEADGRLSALTTLRASIADLRRASASPSSGRQGQVARRSLNSAWVQALEASSALRARKEYRPAAQALALALEIKPGSVGQFYELARLYALGGEERAALQALRSAVEHGFKDVEALRTEPDLERIRRSPEFAVLVERARSY
jgi:poly(3-hydroxybutyrate) depolymerase